MVKNIFLATVICLSSLVLSGSVLAQSTEGGTGLQPKVDKRVELLSIVFRLAGRKEYNQEGFGNYVSDIHKHFDKYQNHPLITYAKTLIDSNGIAYDAVTAIAMYIEQPPSLKPAVKFTDSIPESRWGVKAATKFVTLLQQFYADAKCEQFFKEEESTYKAAEEKYKTSINGIVLKWFEEDRDKYPGNLFHVILGLGNGGNSYGTFYKERDRKEQFYAIIGTMAIDKANSPKTLNDYGIREYPAKDSVEKTFFNPADIGFSKISEEDINSDFSNVKDLAWLQKIAREKKVIFLGELHYSTFVHNFCNRALFAINEADYYPLLIIEQQYSLTPYVNYFLSQTDDAKANEFFKNNLSEQVNTVDDSLLYQDIRRWNKTHIDKPIQVGFIDMEWNRKATLNNILKPYFTKLVTDQTKLDSLFNLGLTEGFMHGIKPLLDNALEGKLVGDFPFITSEYIQNVINNLQTTLDCKTDYMATRQKGIIHNLTDEHVFGKYLKSSKVLFHGGGYHMATHVKDSAGYNFLREGSYFTYDFPETKGKTYSIMLEWIALQLGDMSKIDPRKGFMGQEYKKLITRMKDAYNAGLLKADKPYFTFSSRDEFADLIIHQEYLNDHSALLLNSFNWGDMLKKADGHKDILDLINSKKAEIGLYDSYIMVPYSTIETMRTSR